MDLEQIQLTISGRVQGVGFRFSTVLAAEKFGLKGWVKNLPDGNVQTLAEGSKDKVELFLKWCGVGPPSAKVEKVEVLQRTKISAISFSNFEIIR